MIEIVFTLIALAIVCYATVIAFQNYNKDRARHSLLLFIFFLLLAIWGGLQNFVIITGYTSISPYTHYIFIGTTFVLILFIDTISRDRIDPLKMLFFSNLLTAGIIFLIFDEELLLNMVFSILMFFQAFLWILYTFKIYRKSPHNMKMDALILIIGGILFTLVPVILESLPDFGIGFDVPFDVELSVGMGVLITAYIFKKQPRLAYILPFRAARITAIDTKRGIAIFDHVWDKQSSEFDHDLFVGMMQGISSILTETVNKGDIRLIQLEHAILMIYRDERYPVAFVLISNEFNKALQLALKQFAEKFYLEFSNRFTDLSETSAFRSASNLIDEVFPFIPEYQNA
ncbi:MAG TPA: hypothetical protein VMV49_17160 [Candidatus Deferrimicrobium sp.]|nr:hypothetical protein [Candidatus Deferrimicrobium sp.]